jgi:hypothetical protein
VFGFRAKVTALTPFRNTSLVTHVEAESATAKAAAVVSNADPVTNVSQHREWKSMLDVQNFKSTQFFSIYN